MTACELIREQTQACLDGDLPPGERAGFDAHLMACAACRRWVAGYRTLFAALEEPAVPAPPANFVAGVLRRVGATRRRRAAWQAGAAAAALVAAAVVLALAWNDAAASAAAGLANFGAGEALTAAWPDLADAALGLIESAGQMVSVAPSGFLWAGIVLVLAVVDVLLAYHWRSLAKLNGSHKVGVTQ